MRAMWWCMATSDLIEIKGICKAYSVGGVRSQVLNNVSLCVERGDLLAITGASGSGKSTLMNIMGLLDQGDQGDYLLNQRLVRDLGADELARLRNRHIGFVFQQFHLLPRFNAKQNVALPLLYRGVSPAEIDQRVMQALARVGMDSFALHRPMQLSGGQQQRVAIARALVGEPEVILADEPTGALDSQTGADVMRLFLDLHAEGRTIVIVTHDDRISAGCARRISMTDGQVTAEYRQ
jgi:putative ABC transport system ATP-binding protein